MHRIAAFPIAVIIAGLVAVACAYIFVLVDFDGAALLAPMYLAFGASAVPSGILALAAGRPTGTPRALLWTVRLTYAATLAGLVYALVASPPAADGPLLLGLPRVTAIMLLVTGLIPLVVLPLAYARAFEKDVLGEDDIARIAELALEAAATRERERGPGPARDA